MIDHRSIPKRNLDAAYKTIDKVIFNKPVTVVLWKDGTKTVVKCQECDIDCKYCHIGENPVWERSWKERGLMNAMLKKAYGSKYIDELRKWCK